MEYIKGTKRRANVIGKERESDGSWHYQVIGRDDSVVADIRFASGKEFEHRLLNNDLLEIVADRLTALNESASGSIRSEMCLKHVLEALFWSDAPAHVGKLKNSTTEENIKGDE